MLNLYIVGVGGGGGELCRRLLKFVADTSLEMLQKAGHDITPLLEKAGEIAIPSIVDSITLIDKDTFNPRNAIRQGHGFGSKVNQMRYIMENEPVRYTYLQNLKIIGINKYLNPTNISELIPKVPPRNEENETVNGYFDVREILPKAKTVIFICVDNAASRYDLCKYAEEFDDVLVINGANDKNAGHVTVYERKGGVALDANLPDIFPDHIKPGIDKRPDEVDPCDIVAPTNDQAERTNAIASAFQLSVLSRWVREGLSSFKEGRNTVRKNEFLFDTYNFDLVKLFHPPKGTTL